MSPLLILIVVPCFLAIPVQDAARDREASETPSDQIIEGDMKMTPDQITAIERGQDPTTVRQHRTRKLGIDLRWPGGIVPYTLDSSVESWWGWLGFKSATEKAISSAMKEWEEKTCIRFKPRSSEKDYIEFFYGTGCWSHIGNLGKGMQRISIGRGCESHGTVVHEIGHALGFFHEQSRPDRDDYVEILWENIQKDAKQNFNKYGHGYIDSLGVPYDYGSIMHYGKSDFAIQPGLVTIRVLQPGASIGRAEHLSELDVKQMKLYYSC